MTFQSRAQLNTPETPLRAQSEGMILANDQTPMSHYSLRSFSTLKSTKWVPRTPLQMKLTLSSKEEQMQFIQQESSGSQEYLSPNTVIQHWGTGQLEILSPSAFPARKKSHAVHPDPLPLCSYSADSRNSLSFDNDQKDDEKQQFGESERQEAPTTCIVPMIATSESSAVDDSCLAYQIIQVAYQDVEEAVQSEAEYTESPSMLMYCCQGCDGCSQCCLQIVDDDEFESSEGGENRNDDAPPRKMSYEGGYFLNHANQCERFEFLLDLVHLNEKAKPRLSLPNLASMNDDLLGDEMDKLPTTATANISPFVNGRSSSKRSLNVTRSFDSAY